MQGFPKHSLLSQLVSRKLVVSTEQVPDLHVFLIHIFRSSDSDFKKYMTLFFLSSDQRRGQRLGWDHVVIVRRMRDGSAWSLVPLLLPWNAHWKY